MPLNISIQPTTIKQPGLHRNVPSLHLKKTGQNDPNLSWSLAPDRGQKGLTPWRKTRASMKSPSAPKWWCLSALENHPILSSFQGIIWLYNLFCYHCFFFCWFVYYDWLKQPWVPETSGHVILPRFNFTYLDIQAASRCFFINLQTTIFSHWDLSSAFRE